MFEQKQITIDQTIDARKEKIEAEKAWELLSSADMLYIGKGKKILEYKPSQELKEEILKASLGRTGNLRAPAIKTTDAIYIGFNETLYDKL